MLQAAAAAVLSLASEAWRSHGVLELLAAGAWWRHPAKQPSQCPWSGHAKHSQGKLFTVTTFYTNNIHRLFNVNFNNNDNVKTGVAP